MPWQMLRTQPHCAAWWVDACSYEHEALAALLALLLAVTSGGYWQQLQCILAKGKAAGCIYCRGACCHRLVVL